MFPLSAIIEMLTAAPPPTSRVDLLLQNAAPEETLDFSTVVRESIVEYQVADATPSTQSQRRQKQQRLAEMRAEMQSRLARHRGTAVLLQPAPRYDDVFAEGVQWLDGLAGNSVPEGAGDLSVGDDIWKSEARREPGVS